MSSAARNTPCGVSCDASGRAWTRCAPPIALFATVGNGRCEITRCAHPTSGKCEKPQRSVQSGSALSFALQSATRYNPEPTPTATLANVTHTDGNYGARELTSTCSTCETSFLDNASSAAQSDSRAGTKNRSIAYDKASSTSARRFQWTCEDLHVDARAQALSRVG